MLNDPPKNILSLGAGIQSTTLLLMSCLGQLPKLDMAIFADTQWEPPEVYSHLEWLEQFSADHGIPVHRVTAGNLREHTLASTIRGTKTNGQRYASLPLFVLNGTKKGMIRRQCTREYKIEPVERYIRYHVLGLKFRQWWPRKTVARLWFGISADEPDRMRTSKHKWKQNIYPFCGVPEEHLTKDYTRDDCIAWLAQYFPDLKAPRSACIGCPFHSDAEWLNIRNNPSLWADAVEVDRSIRRHSKRAFLHRSCVPLEDIDFSDGKDKAGFQNDCSGHCGV